MGTKLGSVIHDATRELPPTYTWVLIHRANFTYANPWLVGFLRNDGRWYQNLHDSVISQKLVTHWANLPAEDKSVDSGLPSYAEAEANAALWVVAPELLEACSDLLNACFDGGEPIYINCAECRADEPVIVGCIESGGSGAVAVMRNSDGITFRQAYFCEGCYERASGRAERE